MHFHAAAPPGEWINDPNGLAFVDGRFRLFVQHRADAPDFNVTGWGRFSSDDLLAWDWDGVVLPADAHGYAYSGSLVAGADDALIAWHTRHRPDGCPRERQFSAISHDGGRHWRLDSGPVGPAGHDARDPFLFRHDDAWHMLLARPCDWDDRRGQSRLELARQQPDGRWSPAATVDVAIPAGVLCEVPGLICCDGQWLLLASFIDRRGPTTRSWSGYWPGQLAGGQFRPARPAPIEADYGPDFYAAIGNLAAGWPGPPLLIGWASAWATARQLRLAAGGHGGAITLPRGFAVADGRLSLSPPAAAAGLARPLAWQQHGRLRIQSDTAQAVVRLQPGRISLSRHSGVEACWDWSASWIDDRIGQHAELYFDAGLIELFMAGATATMMVPGTAHSLDWSHDND